MSRRSETIGAGYFDALYRTDPDPWRFRTSDYERDKYKATLGALTRQRYGRALEVGCAIGVLTRHLAQRCDELVAIDGSAVALASATEYCADMGNVRFACATVPTNFPEGPFDLIILSEILYYLVPDDLERVASQCRENLATGGEIVLCHWLGETDYPQSGRDASDRFIANALRPPLTRACLHDDVYRLERLRAP